MNPYDRAAWDEIQAHHARTPTRRIRDVIPARVRERGGELVERGRDKAGELLDDAPGGDQIQEAVTAALEGLTRTIGTTAAASVATPLVVRRYRRRGHTVSRIEHIRGLDLAASDGVFPRRKRFAYITGSMATGAWAGAVTTAGEVSAVAGGVAGVGAGAAPGALVVVGAFAADTASTLLATSRVVAETGALYGYDPNDPAEQIFMTGVLGVATAGTHAGKAAAQRELYQLAQALARNAPWTTLAKNRMTQLVAKVYDQLGQRLTKQQLGKAVPALGIAIGAGANAALMHRVADEAYFAYRERRLTDRYGNGEGVPPVDPPARAPRRGELAAQVADEGEAPLNITALTEEATKGDDTPRAG